jgi:hypothetical protein
MSHTIQIDAAITDAEFKQRLFIICNDCFCCAATIIARMHHVDTHSRCQKAISPIPISSIEAYRYNYTANRGVELEFYTSYTQNEQLVLPASVVYVLYSEDMLRNIPKK